MNKKERSCATWGIAVILVLLLPALLPSTAAAEPPSVEARPPVKATSVLTQPAAMLPTNLEIVSGAAFELNNGTMSIARVEFQLQRGDQISCVSGAGDRETARRFLVEAGTSLVCFPAAGTYAYTVHQTVDGAHEQTRGSVRVY